CKLNPRGHGEEVGLHTVVLIQDLLRTQRLVHTDTGGQDIRLEVGVAHGVDLVDTAVQAFHVQALRLSRLVHWLVVHGEVVHDVFGIFAVHTVNTTGNQVCDLKAECRVVLQDSRVGGRQNREVAIHVLQTLTGAGGAACGSTDDNTTYKLVSCCPQCIARALETEHRVEDVQRNHWLAVRCIGRCSSGKGCHCASFRNTFVHDLTVSCLTVAEHQVMVDRNVVLTAWVPNLQR